MFLEHHDCNAGILVKSVGDYDCHIHLSMDVNRNGISILVLKNTEKKISGRIELVASIELLKKFTTQKYPHLSIWMVVSMWMMVSGLPAANKQNTLLKYLGLFWKLKTRIVLFI